MKCYNSNPKSNCKTNNNYNNNYNINLNSYNLKQGTLYHKNKSDLNMDKESQDAGALLKIPFINDFLQLFRKNDTITESFLGSVSQTPLSVPILGESGSQTNRINALNRSNRSDSVSATGDTSATAPVDTAEQQNIQIKFNEFNQLLGQYTNQYKIMANELVQNNNKEILQKYANSNIKLNNDFYFVNEYGFAHAYDATENPIVGTISASCNFGKPPTEITQLEFNKLLGGRKMGTKQACSVAGYNIENSANGEKSFVDVEGVKHIYSGETWNEKHESCNLDKKSVSDEAYKNIPTGSAMTTATFCATINVDPLVLEQLSTLNKQLQALGNSVLSEINAISASQSTNNNTNFIRSSLTTNLEQLNRAQQDVVRIGDEYKSTGNIGLTTDSSNTIKARVRDTQIVVNMNYLKYILGFILVIFLMGITYYVFSYEVNSPFLVLLLIVLIILVLFNFFTFMYNKLYHKFLNKLLLYG
jgi:hypothetical protein